MANVTSSRPSPIPGGSPKLEEMSCELPLHSLGATAQGCVEAVDLWLDLAL
jgi:hypothetical protein